MGVFFSKPDEEAGLRGRCVCRYVCRNTESKRGGFPFSMRCLVPGKRVEGRWAPQHGPGTSQSHHLYLLPNTERCFLKSVPKAGAGQVCVSRGGFEVLSERSSFAERQPV